MSKPQQPETQYPTIELSKEKATRVRAWFVRRIAERAVAIVEAEQAAATPPLSPTGDKPSSGQLTGS